MARKRASANELAMSDDTENSKRQLQRQMERARDSLAETVGEIKETVEQEVDLVKSGVSSVLNYREEFQKDPVVWSLGALSAGFALGYTVGYAHKNTKGSKKSEITAFADNMIEQLSSMGQGLVLPALDAKISELFGFKFSAMLDQIASDKKLPKKKGTSRSRTSASKTKRSSTASKKAVTKPRRSGT